MKTILHVSKHLSLDQQTMPRDGLLEGLVAARQVNSSIEPKDYLESVPETFGA